MDWEFEFKKIEIKTNENVRSGKLEAGSWKLIIIH